MGNIGNFKASDYKQVKSWECIPDGWYLAVVEDSQVKATKKGDGEYINFRFKLLKEHAGRVYFFMTMTKHPNEKTVSIGMAQLSSMFRAAGIEDMQDSSQLHGKILKIKLKKKFDDYKGEDSSFIVDFGPKGDESISIPTKAPKQAEPQKVQDDDVPF